MHPGWFNTDKRKMTAAGTQKSSISSFEMRLSDKLLLILVTIYVYKQSIIDVTILT